MSWVVSALPRSILAAAVASPKPAAISAQFSPIAWASEISERSPTAHSANALISPPSPVAMPSVCER
jgi:hypothetical protein